MGCAERQHAGFRGGCNETTSTWERKKCFCLSRLGKTAVRNSKTHNGRSARVPGRRLAPALHSGRRPCFKRNWEREINWAASALETLPPGDLRPHGLAFVPREVSSSPSSCPAPQCSPSHEVPTVPPRLVQCEHSGPISHPCDGFSSLALPHLAELSDGEQAAGGCVLLEGEHRPCCWGPPAPPHAPSPPAQAPGSSRGSGAFPSLGPRLVLSPETLMRCFM